jgi:hypothetical protein
MRSAPIATDAIDPDIERDLIKKIGAHVHPYLHDVPTVLHVLMSVAGVMVNGTGPDALAVRRWAIDDFDRAIVAARRMEQEIGDG